jgi:hypothetical protein
MILGPVIRICKSMCRAIPALVVYVEFIRPGTKLFRSGHEAFSSPDAKLEEARYKTFLGQE